MADVNFTPVDAPIQRSLILCKSSELPDKGNRNKYGVYFVYDKLELHLYQSRYTDPFCIVDSLGDDKEILTDRMLYITTDGEMYSYHNHVVYKLGELVDPSQKDLLTKCGTSYIMNAESRYFDKQKRILQLPFQNGTYQLNLSLAKDIKIDEDTVIKFNPDTEQFYIAGKEYQFEDKLNNIYRYSGLVSSTVINDVDNHTFRSKIRLSPKEGNDLQDLFNGLFVSVGDLASKEDYMRMIEIFAHVKMKMDGYINQLIEALTNAQASSSDASLRALANEVLEDYKDDIDDMYVSYDTLYDRLVTVENTISEGFDEALDNVEEDIKNYINQTNNAWSALPEPTGANRAVNRFDIDSEIKGAVLEDLRSSLVSIRDKDTDYSNGLTDEEKEVQIEVLSALNNTLISLDSGIEKTSI